MRHSLITLLLLSLLLAPARGQTTPQLTQSAVAGGGGVSTQGSLRVEGAVGQPSAGASTGGAFTLYGGFFAPGQGTSVLSVARASANPAVQNSSVGYTVTFNSPVTGVDAADFMLTTAGVTGASVTGVTGAGATYGVTVNTGTPASAGATLRLDVVDDDTITDAGGDLLGGTGVGNGNFTSGEVYTVNPITARANAARVSEPPAGTTPLLFTVTLSSPATNSVSVNYATADGGATPATGGAACGGAVDYETTSGTLNFSAGQQVKTVSVDVCADAASGESDETLLLNLSGATGGNVQVAQATGTITQGTTPGALVISELRTFGPGGSNDPNDEFVELYNNTDTPLTVAASDATAGYGVFTTGASCDATPVLVGTIPNGTVIPARGHYLMVGTAYSLANYGGTGAAAGDLTMSSDIPSNGNVALFSTADVANVSTSTRLDAVGFGSNTGAVCDLLREGATLPPAAANQSMLGQHSYFRRQCDFVSAVGCATSGNTKDTGENAADLLFADTNGTTAGAGQRLGAPGPENLSSPVRRDTSGVSAALLDSSVPSSVGPNRARDFASGDNATYGTLSIRRRVTNTTGSPVTRLRFRIVELTTFPVDTPGNADLRAVTSTSVSVTSINDPGTCSPASPPCTVTVGGTTLETPPGQPGGGGYNSTLSAGAVTLGTPLANNAAVNLQFVLGIETTGKFRFYIIVEALP
ncbi:MAG TPA: Calx-beta domain-containing protein [Pyrinomonadaceae bacterium]